MKTVLKTSILYLYFLYFIARYCKNRLRTLILLFNQKPININLKSGQAINAPVNNFRVGLVFKEIFLNQVYNPPYLPISNGDLVVDIGAGIGIFTIYAAKKTSNIIYACEPLRIPIKSLEKNIKDNKLANVIVKKIAISDQNKHIRIFVHDIFEMSSLYPLPENKKPIQSEVVECQTIEKFMIQNKIKKIGFLKIDCEGAEGNIIKSASLDTLSKIDKIALEFHDNLSILDHMKIIKKLKSAGFKTKLNWNGKSPYGYLYAYRTK